MVLRETPAHVRLIVSRNVDALPDVPDPSAPVIPVEQLDRHLAYLNSSMDFSRLSSDADLSEFHASLQTLPV